MLDTELLKIKSSINNIKIQRTKILETLIHLTNKGFKFEDIIGDNLLSKDECIFVRALINISKEE